MYQTYQTIRQQNANPKNLLKQITRNFDKNAMQDFKNQANQLGLDISVIDKL